MPQASPELQQKMKQRFGDIGDIGPSGYLERAGYALRRDWCWTAKAGVSSLRDMTREEFDCLLFLAHEYDYGHLVLSNGEKVA